MGARQRAYRLLAGRNRHYPIVGPTNRTATGWQATGQHNSTKTNQPTLQEISPFLYRFSRKSGAEERRKKEERQKKEEKRKKKEERSKKKEERRKKERKKDRKKKIENKNKKERGTVFVSAIAIALHSHSTKIIILKLTQHSS